MKIALFIRDFLLGTQISDRLASMGKEVVFCERLRELPVDPGAIILDLDEKDFGIPAFVSALKIARPQVQMIGFMRQIQNQQLAEMKAAGCSVIISQSAAVKNIQTIIRELSQ
jgi:DNA-binding NarL/FixJ family response regulator